MMMGRPRTRSTNPYRLLDILHRHGIQQRDMRKRVLHERGVREGQPLAASTMSAIVVERSWPRTCDRQTIVRAIEQFLRDQGVPEAEIAEAWAYDGKVDAQATPSSSDPSRQPIEGVTPAEDDFQLPEREMISQQAREHFRLSRNPFIDDVQGPDDVFLSADQRYVRESMYYAAKHNGIVAVIGDSGSGKSTLRRDLIDRIRRESEQLVLIQPKCIDKNKLTVNHICDAIIADLSHEAPKQSLEAKARQVERILAASARAGFSHAIMIEEAHDLSIPVLKYLKRFWELEDGFKKLLGVILIGQTELLDILNEQRNPSLREFIRRCEIATLKPLNGSLEKYITLKFKRVGVDLADVFEADAYDAIRMRLTRRRPNSNVVESHVFPLVVNNLLVKAMNAACELGLPKVSADLVGRV